MSTQKLHLQDPRYFVRVDGAVSPTICYHSLEAAERRAQQLARQTLGRVFVYAPILCYEPVPPSTEFCVVMSEVSQ